MYKKLNVQLLSIIDFIVIRDYEIDNYINVDDV